MPCIREDLLFDVILDKHMAPFAIITLQRKNKKIRKKVFISYITKVPEGRHKKQKILFSRITNATAGE